jgi:hypothetical protein
MSHVYLTSFANGLGNRVFHTFICCVLIVDPCDITRRRSLMTGKSGRLMKGLLSIR